MMTPLESECLDLLEIVRDFLTAKKPRLHQYETVLGYVRDSISRLTNKKYGCSTGRHSKVCKCKSTAQILKEWTDTKEPKQ